MNCVFGPYKVTSPSFSGIEGTVFMDTEKTRRIAIVSSCDSSIPAPCEGAIAVSQTVCEESNCNIRWYECPSILGRTYTIFPTPCGVTITSFEDGLLSLNNCSATVFGSTTFCFGKVYSSAGEFSGNSNSVNFEFDGHSFTVEGTSGTCNEFLDCGTCSRDSDEITAFATLPEAPPEVADEDIETEAAPDDESVPETEIIPSENRTVWHNIPELSPPDTGAGTTCDPEVDITSWETPGATPSRNDCDSNDNPSVAVLSSGHTIIAYEERNLTGLAQIRVAILKNSVNRNVIYHRRLSKGTLINDPGNEEQVFEAFEEMVINVTGSNVPTNASLSIGFLSGPLVGAQSEICTTNCLYSVTKAERTIENDRVKHTFTFTPDSPTVFPDQNDVSDVSWFLADDGGGDIPPDSANTITMLDADLTTHKFPVGDSGIQVPVANPSIAVARNNQMISSEQNIFLVYQAFEENQWRVYLRQIVLGEGLESDPTYSAPYLFPDQSPVSIMSLGEGGVSAFSATTIFDDTFGYYTDDNQQLHSLPDTPNWHFISVPFDYIDSTETTRYNNYYMRVCKNLIPVFPESGCTSDNPNTTCRVELGTQGGCNATPHDFCKTFITSTIPAEDSNGDSHLRTKFSLRFSMEQEENINFFPELWFLLGRQSVSSSLYDGWRIRVERHNGPGEFGNDGFIKSSCGAGTGSCDHNCFVISIYNGWNMFGGFWNSSRTAQDGTRHDVWLQQIKVCVDNLNGAGDYLTTEWNTISIETYLRGRSRVFRVSLDNDNNTDYELVKFQEMDESTYNSTTQSDTEPITFGKYYGFGLVNHNVPIRSSIDRATLTAPDETDENKHIFYEEFFDYSWNHTLPGSPAILPSSLGQSPFRYLSQVENEPNSWTTEGYVYANSVLCSQGLDTRYPNTNGFNTWIDIGTAFPKYDHLSIDRQEFCNTSITGDRAFWSIIKIDVPTELRRNKTSPFNPIYNTSIYSSFSHGNYIEGNGEQWGNIWFLMRQDESSSAWHTGWRLRVRYYLVAGVTYYTLDVYDGDTSSGDPGDTPVATTTINPVPASQRLFAHISNSAIGSPSPYREAVIPYFRVDITTDTTETKIELYEAPKVLLATGVQPSDYTYSLVHSFTGLDVKHFGTYYGIALMTGATDDDPLDIARDWRSKPIVDYLQIRSLDDDPTPPTGSCCRATGGCDDTTENECISPDVWDVTALCANKDCTAIFTYGASCRESDGACFSSTLTGVPSDFGDFADGLWIENKNCILGDVDYRNCPQPTGSCCKPDETCSDISKIECESLWGLSFQNSYWVESGSCSGVTCDSAPAASGACCLDSFAGCHSWVTSAQCTTLDGTFLGAGTDCTSCVGACCHDGGCADTYYLDCLSLSAYASPIWFGNGTTCAGVTCTDPTGACCFADGQCGVVTNAACTSFTGATWDVSGVCNPNTCPLPPGACCNPFTGECTQETEVDCKDLGYTFVDGDCELSTCPDPTGACCINGKCSQKSLIYCVNQGGIHFGDNSQCLPDHCSLQDPYLSHNVNYKPEDLWVIQTGDNEFITRVLYHMQENIITSSVSSKLTNAVDFMFIIDVSGSMDVVIESIVDAVPLLAANIVNKGLDVRFGLALMSRGVPGTPIPDDKIRCPDDSREGDGFPGYLANGLQASSVCVSSFLNPNVPDEISEVVGAWTKSPEILQAALNCWWTSGGVAAAYAAIQFGIEDPRFNDPTYGWRSDAQKYAFMITDTSPTECECIECDIDNGRNYSNSHSDALNSLIDNNVVLIPAVCVNPDPCSRLIFAGGGEPLVELSRLSGWDGEIFSVSAENYGSIFSSVAAQIDISVRTDQSTIIERAKTGSESTLLKQAEVIVSYDGDLSDLWTFNKTDFEFSDSHAPFPGTTTKQLANFPFTLASGRVYGIDPVHIQGIPENWVSFGQEGGLRFDHPNVGARASSVADPILMSTNSTRPSVFVNNRNQVIVAYENYESGSAQIAIKGTGDFHQNSITGPKGSRLHRFYVPSEFEFNHAITLDGEGVNQLCDFVTDSSDITHITWQSNRDNEWEIYYANSSNLFEPVRITKADSRSSIPSIDAEESGNIFVVYHDNRFGPFEVMLATKTEERVIPLLEQDAYMASIRNGYAHYTNIIPIVVNNPVQASLVETAQLWGSKTSDSPGNDNESYIYKINQDTGSASDGGDSGFGMDHIAFHPDGRLYGIRVIEDNSSSTGVDQATLYLISDFGDGGDVEITQTPTVIGDINLETWNLAETGRQAGRILDIDFDSFGRLWIFLWSRAPDLFIHAFRHGAFKWVDTATASIRAESREEISGLDSVFGAGDRGFAINSNNNFYWGGAWQFSSTSQTISFLNVSPYPIISTDALNPSGRLATFDSSLASGILNDPRDSSVPMSIESMTFNETNNILIVSSDNDLFLFDVSSRVIQFLISLTTDSQLTTGPLPVGTTSSISLLLSSTGTITTGEGEFFHALIKFYDNFAMSGEPYLLVDSRENLEAFVTEESISDPYDPYLVTGMDARGLLLEPGQSGIIFFDATQFRPGHLRESVPYSFEPNQTYFPKVFSIDSNNSILETVRQNSSFSCSSCSRFGTNNFDSSGCSYSFVVTNNSGSDQWYNFQVDFYADVHKQHLLRRFELIGGNDDLQFAEVDNQTAISKWGSTGLYIRPEDAVFIQVYPSLDASSGFLCGINYSVQINQCFSFDNSECSDFSIITPTNWDAVEVQNSEQISTDFTPVSIQSSDPPVNPVAIGMDMHSIGGKIAIAYRTKNDNLAYVTYDGLSEWAGDIVAPDITNKASGYVSLGTSQGRAAVVFTLSSKSNVNNANIRLRSRIFNGVSWEDGGISFDSFNEFPLRYAVMFDDSDPMTAITPRVNRSSEQYHTGSFPPPSTIEHFALGLGFVGDYCDTATINELPHCLFWAGNNLYLGIRQGESQSPGDGWDLFLADDDLGFSKNTEQWESPGRPAIAELEGGVIAAAYIKQDGASVSMPLSIDETQRRLVFRTFNGTEWNDIDTGIEAGSYNKSLSMEVINGQPYIAYTVNNGTTCDLKVAIYNGSSFRHEIIAESISTQDPQVDVIKFQSRAAITITASPLTVYLQRKDSLITLGEFSSTFFCECSSKIFPDRMVHLAEVSKWEASAHGYSDTRVTESPKNSLRPKVATRITGTAIIVWEDYNCDNAPCIKAATFRNVNQDQLRSSGTGSWYDFDFKTPGQHPDLALDIYDRAITSYEKPIPASEEGFFGKGITKEELPTNKIFSKVCDFDPETVPGEESDTPTSEACDIEKIEANVITVDEFISSTIVKKIRVKDEFVQYYTYNASGRLTAVVSNCEITLEIHGTPEIVALRFRNENQTVFGAWCPWSPQIGDFMTEKKHKLSGSTGIKEVCVQAMTYTGVTVQFCVPIIADYETVVFETRFYKNTFTNTSDFQAIDIDRKFTTTDSELEELPLSDGLAVANLAPQISDNNDLTLAPTELTILFEIIPNKDPEDNVLSIEYDVLQQGADDTPGRVAVKGQNNDRKITFRGSFSIKKEDNILNVDGLARISPKFPQVCDEVSSITAEAATKTYDPNQYNLISREIEVEITEEIDVLESYRQDVSGRVGVDIDIRSQEDPYFVFGDPNYSLRKEDGERLGVPLGVPADIFGLGLGLAPTDLCFGKTCEPNFVCDSNTGNCIEKAGSR